MNLPPPRSTLFPYTTLFRSRCAVENLHQAVGIVLIPLLHVPGGVGDAGHVVIGVVLGVTPLFQRSEEHTSELQSRQYLVYRLLLEKQNTEYYFSTCLLHFCE